MATGRTYSADEIERAILTPGDQRYGWTLDEIVYQHVTRRRDDGLASSVVVVAILEGPTGRVARFSILFDRGDGLQRSFQSSRASEVRAIRSGAAAALDMASRLRANGGRIDE